MSYTQAIDFVRQEIRRKQHEIETLKECIKYLENDSNSNDELTQTPEQILKNFGCRLPTA
jgi:uncharacterized protein YigA (DUF484 family)